jgi:hypothetical protein
MAEGVRYIKVARIDGDGIDNTNSLQSLTKITIPYSSGNVTYDILNISRYRHYFLYYVENPNIEWSDRGDLNYNTTGSISGFLTTSFSLSTQVNYNPQITPLTDPLNLIYSNVYNLDTYPQKDIFIHATGSFQNENNGAVVYQKAYLFERKPNNNTFLLDSSPYIITPASTGPPSILTSSFDISANINKSSSIGSEFFIRVASECTGTPRNFTSSLGPSSFLYITSSTSLGSQLETIPEPHFSSDWDKAYDCQPLLNNVTRERSNPFLQDLDYDTSQTVPVNIIPIISESATKATVPESYYTSLAQTNIRYNGSKNQSEKINEYTPNDNIGTYGKTSPIEVDDTVIYEYEWAGGTTPEILGWGAYKMGKLLNVKTVDDVRTINPGVGLRNQSQPIRFPLPPSGMPYYYRNAYISQSVSEYYYTLNGNNPTNSNITIFPYETTIGESSPTITKVLTPDFGVPTISNFALTSSNSRYGNINSGSQHIYFTQSVDISRVKKSNGDYASGEVFDPESFLLSPSESLYPSLNEGERWFITLFNELEFPINNIELIPYNVGFTGSLEDNYINPLGYKGVFEIFGAWSIDSNHFSFLTDSQFSENRIIGGGGLGALIWKARAAGDNEFVMVQSEVGSSGPGCFVDQYATDEIIQNLEQITKKFGSNKT